MFITFIAALTLGATVSMGAPVGIGASVCKGTPGLLQTTPSAKPPIDLLVVDDKTWTKTPLEAYLITTSRNPPLNDLIDDLTKRGYHLYEQGKARFMFSPGIWQQAKFELGLKLLEKIGSHTSKDGILVAGGDQEVLQFERSLFGESGISLADDAVVGVGVQPMYTLTSGEKTIFTRGEIAVSPAAQAAEEASIQVVTNQPPKAGSSLDIRIIWPTTFEIHGFGRYLHSGDTQIDGFREALDVLHKQLSNYFLKKKLARLALVQKLTGLDPTSLKGQQFSNLPAGMKTDLLGKAKNDFGSLGFNSSDEAISFLNTCSLSEFSEQFFLGVKGRPSDGSVPTLGYLIQIP